jgi:hypothetical protein
MRLMGWGGGGRKSAQTRTRRIGPGSLNTISSSWYLRTPESPGYFRGFGGGIGRCPRTAWVSALFLPHLCHPNSPLGTRRSGDVTYTPLAAT